MDRIEEMIQNLELLRMHFGDITKTCMANGIIDSIIKSIEKFRTYENAERQGLPDGYGAGAKYAHTKKPQTNADRIRSMTDEELAVNMMCPNENGLAEIDCDKNDNCNCYECLLRWLRAENEEATWKD